MGRAETRPVLSRSPFVTARPNTPTTLTAQLADVRRHWTESELLAAQSLTAYARIHEDLTRWAGTSSAPPAALADMTPQHLTAFVDSPIRRTRGGGGAAGAHRVGCPVESDQGAARGMSGHHVRQRSRPGPRPRQPDARDPPARRRPGRALCPAITRGTEAPAGPGGRVRPVHREPGARASRRRRRGPALRACGEPQPAR
jgi:hypothetical protein